MKKNLFSAIIVLYSLFLTISNMTEFQPGVEISRNFLSFFYNMIILIPCVFVLIGLFETWVKRETVERHLGKDSGIRGFLWAVALAGSTVGGMYVAFPVAHSMFQKGARLSVIFTYIGAAGICRIPMTAFEATFLGLKFTLIRLIVALPAIIITGIIMGSFLEKHNYHIMGES